MPILGVQLPEFLAGKFWELKSTQWPRSRNCALYCGSKWNLHLVKNIFILCRKSCLDREISELFDSFALVLTIMKGINVWDSWRGTDLNRQVQEALFGPIMAFREEFLAFCRIWAQCETESWWIGCFELETALWCSFVLLPFRWPKGRLLLVFQESLLLKGSTLTPNSLGAECGTKILGSYSASLRGGLMTVIISRNEGRGNISPCKIQTHTMYSALWQCNFQQLRMPSGCPLWLLSPPFLAPWYYPGMPIWNFTRLPIIQTYFSTRASVSLGTEF